MENVMSHFHCDGEPYPSEGMTPVNHCFSEQHVMTLNSYIMTNVEENI